MMDHDEPHLARSQRGAAAIEFALSIPVLLLLLLIIAQIGILCFAHAGLQNMVGEAARYATLYPRPSDSQILGKLQASAFGLQQSTLVEQKITHGTANGSDFVLISTSYSVPVGMNILPNFSITMKEERRAYLS